MTLYDVIDIAEYVIQRCKTLNCSISNLKLQKILYFIQAEFLVKRNKQCFNENIEAWDFGTVVPKVYYKYRVFGSSNIITVEKPDCNLIKRKDRKLLNSVIDECSKYSSCYLLELILNQAPWKEAYRSKETKIISAERIKEYFLTN